MRHHSFVQWFALGAVLLAWAMVGFFAWSIAGSEHDIATQIENAQKSSTKEASAIRTRALALGTARERTQLGELLDIDVSSIVDMIEGVGKAGGAAVTLSSALPESGGAGIAGGTPIKVIGFNVQAQGSFAALMRVAHMFETLPIPSTLKSLDIEHAPNPTPSGPATLWHMNASIRVLTTADISS
ncbi:hypothetical protein A3H16_00200 [Candidatus Kaiserbacteria bacterium RIFCSPLOWO2_12_FULL_53_8]|uniref:Uncharacterized protein n=2 Tax=Candidatus Kaiseribacteriota TaxID=1752734 RepID=A0A1F6CTD3_9BACT|nr:MAG: hypothetical protein A2851_04940 [Candidatus Kaiserbacteria bacterium RIFCSPHIGHO2_01_FULL_53_29]OGG90940.1 MAG: hypothetical protein A3H16_00200 [Candidatus Kaiserbacteria bacterium RIFCSPLOWO2_12_FULL_53_8]